jgi:hypothetical protein
MLARHLDDALLVQLACAPAAGAPSLSHAGKRTSTRVDV